MAKVRTPKDLLQGYAWMKRMVLGMEDQSIKTSHEPGYGNTAKVFLEVLKGWRAGISGSPRIVGPYAQVIADHTFILGTLQYHNATGTRAALIPPELAPAEEYTFITHRENDHARIEIKIGTDGYIRIPPHKPSTVILALRYPTNRNGG